MIKSTIKLGFAASVIAASALFFAGCSSDSAVAKKPSIDGGVMYPVENGKTSVYAVNEAVCLFCSFYCCLFLV